MNRRCALSALGLIAAAAWSSRVAALSAPDARPAGMRWRSTLYRDHRLAGAIWSVMDDRRVDEQALSSALRAARYRLLGEMHDNPDHHAIQLEQLGRLAKEGVKPVVAFEQFDREHDAALQERLRGPDVTAEDVASAVRLDRKGWNWEYYRPLVEIALKYHMQLRAANLSRDDAQQIIKDGLNSLGAQRIAALRLERAWSPEREQALRKHIFDGHCRALPERLLPAMAAAQRARDATMAESLLDAGPDGAVLIAGNGHVRRDLAAPLYLGASPGAGATCSVGILEVEEGKTEPRDYAETAGASPAAFDFVCFTPAWDRPDPCATFKPRSQPG